MNHSARKSATEPPDSAYGQMLSTLMGWVGRRVGISVAAAADGLYPGEEAVYVLRTSGRLRGASDVSEPGVRFGQSWRFSIGEDSATELDISERTFMASLSLDGALVIEASDLTIMICPL